MDEVLHPALLPAGMRDILPPHAEFEAALVERLMRSLRLNGYERVEPPMLEFESSLLDGPGAAMAQDTFRLMDPVSHRMVGLRADMTLQIARIATTRLTRSPRPLRLSYTGQVLRVRGSQLQPERQLRQVGAELIGSEAPTADAEVVLLGAEALLSAGVKGLSVDLTLPTLVPAILSSFGIDGPVAQRLRSALDHKDAARIDAVAGSAARLLGSIMAACGNADQALQRIRALDLPDNARVEMDRLVDITQLVRRVMPDLALTIDAVENRGFEYHSGMTFTFFSRGIRGELGRGGRYRASTAGAQEPSTGFTLYMDSLMRAVSPTFDQRSVYLPLGTSSAEGAALRQQDWITIAALDDRDPRSEAARLGCTHLLQAGGPAALIPED